MSLPRLSSFKGAFKTHYVRVQPSGDIVAKNLPCDLSERRVVIRATWRRVGDRLAEHQNTVFDEESDV